MKLETFFEKFDQFANAPDAVEKMRELVLQLAVTGKLVNQDKRDEPASVLLESTEAERAKLIAAKKIKSRPTSHVESNEQPFDLPSSWAWARLSDVGYELGQKVPDKRFTYIDVGGIDSEKGRISDRVEKLEPGEAPSRARKLVARGTVIYSTVRPYLLNIAIIDEDFDPEPIASTAFGILHPFTGINNRYLFYWLRSAPFTTYVQAGMKGMAYPAINDEKFYSGFIALPPLAEQKRIVAKVDELMVLCDRLEAQQQERETRHAELARASLARFAGAPTPANLNFLFHPSYAVPPADLRKSILTLAVQGKLVPQDPNDESAEVLLARLMSRDAEASGRRKKSQPDLALTADEIPFALPSGWKWEYLGNIGETNIGLTYSPQDVSDVGIPVLRSSNVQNGKLDFDDLVRLKCEPKQSAMVQDGDLLICARNGSKALVGKVAVIEDLKEPAAFGAFMAIYRSEVNSYLYHFIRSPLFRQMIDDVNTTTINQITQNNLRSTLAPIPPLAEQRRIVARVEQLMTLVDALEAQLDASRATSANLLSALVAELTGTPNDGKVSVPSSSGTGRRGRPPKSS